MRRQERPASGCLLLAGWACVGGRLYAASLDEKRDTSSPLPPLLSFSNLGTIEVRFQVGADVFPLEALGIEPRASHILSTTELYFHPR